MTITFVRGAKPTIKKKDLPAGKNVGGGGTPRPQHNLTLLRVKEQGHRK